MQITIFFCDIIGLICGAMVLKWLSFAVQNRKMGFICDARAVICGIGLKITCFTPMARGLNYRQ